LEITKIYFTNKYLPQTLINYNRQINEYKENVSLGYIPDGTTQELCKLTR